MKLWRPTRISGNCFYIGDENNAFAVLMHDPEAVLRRSVTLVGCEPIPPHRLGVVLRDGVALLGRKADRLGGGGEVPG